MSLTQMDLLAPLTNPLPEPPAGEFFTESQWTTLLAIMDTVIPSVRCESTSDHKVYQRTISDVEYNAAVDHLRRNVTDLPDNESLAELLNERPSDIPEFKDVLLRTVVHYSREDVRKGLAFILSALK